MGFRPSTKAKETRRLDAAYRAGFAERLKLAVKEYGVPDLAEQIGVTTVTLYRWLNGTFDPSLPKLARMADVLNISLAWLVTGVGPKHRGQALQHAQLENYAVPTFESGGAGDEKSPLAFHEPWALRLLLGSAAEPTSYGPSTMDPPLLIEVRDDSMEPTIAQGDLLLVDRAFGTRPDQLDKARRHGFSPHDGLYAFRPRGPHPKAAATTHPVFRRVQFKLEGTMLIRCDNPRYPEEFYGPKDPNRPKPLGRVVWHAGRI